MAKKKKSKLKNFLKGAALAGAAALGAKALMNNRARNAMLSSADANDGFRAPFKRPNMRDIAGMGDAMPGNLSSDMGMGMKRRTRNMYSPNDFGLGPYDGAKKGGRAGKDFGKRGVGKAKRGFGRALKGGKK